MIEQQLKHSWVVERCEVPEAASIAQVRRHLLGLHPHPALFETGGGFQAVDGSQTMFMIDLLFELILVNGIWRIRGCGPFEEYTTACRLAVNDCNQSLWKRLRQVTQILALPDNFPLVLVLGYSAARFVEHLPKIAIEAGVPEVVLRVYRYVVRYDGTENGAQVDVLKINPDETIDTTVLFAALTAQEDVQPPTGSWDLGSMRDLTDQSVFYAAVNRAKEYIRSGDIYQVQLCRRAVSNATIPPVDLYERLVSINPAPYMYYLALDDQHIISSSPELMIRIRDGVAQVRPIAGTITQKDLKGGRLNQIPKEVAEHLMLVDLARNDLARCAIPGGVKVTSFMQEDIYGPLIHLVSTIETGVRDNCDIWDLIAANFPAGTMTGAPKVRAMEIITELEGIPRGLFAGCAGYLMGENCGVLALTIRTIIGDSGCYVLQSAAGIVADSQASAEWAETGVKIKSFARAMGGRV
ncbi:anthranilate synthase component I [Xenorhabdus vietnamensis]|uniref:Anthranilate synthase component I n=1 Tax=Xenorhabdus vietnamensis TaxID=351656 RepID=A0A1Y2S6V4_9GAMM|nr:anthranilate synthase component I family protein [Xenorhabdus vietnamensis]OTA14359.1 anthranilate synthase component I [Xenorhabdus vietnamensis]UVN17720.1 2-amino-4-deoxychorismate synthase [Xenorhabdus vietnamensis]